MVAVETKRTSVVLNALAVTLRLLAEMPASAETDALRRRIADCEREAKQWRAAQPTPQEREGVMKRVLVIHTEVARLRRAPA
jgi:hypothetical protein